MNEKRSSTNRPVEVQLGQRPGESTPAQANDGSGYKGSTHAPKAHPGTAIQTDRGNTGCNISVGAPEWFPTTETILESYSGTVVVVEVGKDGSLPARPATPGKI